jgi:type IV pilus assembly protein PilQ
MILRNTQFTFRESEGVFFVGQKENKALLATRLFRLKYLRAEQALDMVPQSITSVATIKVSKEHNGIVAIGPGDVLAQTEEFLSKIDQPVPQVLLEAVVVEFDRTKGLDLGVNAGRQTKTDTSRVTQSYIPGLDFVMDAVDVTKRLGQFGVKNLGSLPSDFYLRLRALEQRGVANVRSRPLLATLNGHQASLSIGTTQYFILKTTTPYRDPNQVILQESQTFTQIDADIKLEITPFVGSDGLITVDIKPDFKTPIGTLNPDTPPTINRRAMSSTIIMREGETIVLGGLIQESDSEVRSQTPILGSIPLLGYLFASTSTSKSKSELLIYVTPHVSYGEAFKVSGLAGKE